MTRSDEHILAERARRLARPLAAAEPEPGRPALLFCLGTARHALDVACVHDVVRLTDVTPVPGAAAALLGVVHHRGEVLPVFDLRPLLAINAGGPAGWLVVAGRQAPDLALVADDVLDVVHLPDAALRPPPGAADALVRGVTDAGVTVLCPDHLFDDGRLYVGAH